jgi:hypothetical protein
MTYLEWTELETQLDQMRAAIEKMPESKGRAAFVNTLNNAIRQLQVLRHALDKSVKLQSHYAKLLNDFDGGKRTPFASPEAWIDRLQVLAFEQTEEKN